MVNKISRLVIVGFAIGLLTSPAFAEIEEVKLQVDGLACPFCVYGLEKKLKKISEVSDYEISLKDGEASVVIEKGALLDLGKFNEAVKRAGFTLKEVSITAVGNITTSQAGFALEVIGSGQRFLLFESDLAHEKYHEGEKLKTISDTLERKMLQAQDKGSHIRIKGTVHEHADLALGLLIQKYEEVS